MPQKPKPASSLPKEEMLVLSELFWRFHNDRLANPELTEMKPYIQPILALLAQEVNRIIGEDEPPSVTAAGATPQDVRNQLRAEQRRKAGLV